MPTWKAELMIAPRAVCSRRLRPSEREALGERLDRGVDGLVLDDSRRG